MAARCWGRGGRRLGCREGVKLKGPPCSERRRGEGRRQRGQDSGDGPEAAGMAAIWRFYSICSLQFWGLAPCRERSRNFRSNPPDSLFTDSLFSDSIYVCVPFPRCPCGSICPRRGHSPRRRNDGSRGHGRRRSPAEGGAAGSGILRGLLPKRGAMPRRDRGWMPAEPERRSMGRMPAEKFLDSVALGATAH